MKGWALSHAVAVGLLLAAVVALNALGVFEPTLSGVATYPPPPPLPPPPRWRLSEA